MHGLPQFIIAILLLSLTAFSSCTPSRVGEAMRRADSLMTSAPDSALALLDSIDPATLRTDAARARHAVLLTRARHLAYVPVYDDSLIAIGTDYYATHGTHAEKAEAFYMSSVVNHYNNRYEQSIVDGLRAEKHALATSDHLLLGLIYRTIADGFDRLYDWSSALHYYTLSYDNFKLAPENIYTDWAGIDLARAYLYQGELNKCIELADKAIEHGKQNNDNAILVETYRMLGNGYSWSGNHSLVIDFYDKVIEIAPETMTERDYSNLGSAYLSLGNTDKANQYQACIYSLNPDNKSLESLISEHEGDYRNAYKLLTKELAYQNNIVSKITGRSYARTISDYFKTEENNSAIKIEKNRQLTVIISIASILIMISMIIIFNYRSRLQRHEKELIICEARELRNILQEKENEVSEVSEARSVSALAKENVRGLLASRFEILDRLCSTYFQFKGLSNERDKISNEVLSIISEIQNDKEMREKLEEIVNSSIGNLMARLRKDVPNLKERDYELYLFLILDFSPSAISIFQGDRTEAVYNRKSRLKRKIALSGSESVEEYLLYMR